MLFGEFTALRGDERMHALRLAPFLKTAPYATSGHNGPHHNRQT
jgi:hypothetical protein